MTSKHYKWQTRWQHHPDRGLWSHTDSGLEVLLDDAGRPRALNAAEAQARLAVKNGPHNAPLMVERLLREATQLAAAAKEKAHVPRR
jgi:hypothetical protein